MFKYIIPLLQDLKTTRIAKGMSQSALAKKVGIPQSHLSKIESGNVNIQLTSLVEISRMLGQELMFVPRQKIALVKKLILSKKSTKEEYQVTPAYRLDEELEGEE